MAEGEVSLWIRVRDGFTAGINSAKSALNSMVASSADVARGASSAIGGELKRIWGGISDNLGRVLGDIPGVRKMADILRSGQASIVGGAMAGATAIYAMIEKISGRYAELAGEIERVSLRISSKQEQILSKFASAKTGEAFNAIDRDLIGEVSTLEQELSALRSKRAQRGIGSRMLETVSGTRGLEREKELQLQNAIKLLERQREFAKRRGGEMADDEQRKREAKAANEQLINSQQAAVSMRDAAKAIELAGSDDREKALSSEAERLKEEIESLNRALSTGVAQWTDENRSALQSLVSDYQRASVDLIKEREQKAKKDADEREKEEKEQARKVAKAQKEAAEKAGKKRIEAAEKAADAEIALAERIAEQQIAAAKAVADRFNFRDRRETFKEKVDALVARREEAKQAAKENREFREKEFKLREKVERGTQLKKADQQFLKDIAQQRAGQRADAAFAAKEAEIKKNLEARRKQVEDAVLSIRDKVESVLQASGGPN